MLQLLLLFLYSRLLMKVSSKKSLFYGTFNLNIIFRESIAALPFFIHIFTQKSIFRPHSAVLYPLPLLFLSAPSKSQVRSPLPAQMSEHPPPAGTTAALGFQTGPEERTGPGSGTVPDGLQRRRTPGIRIRRGIFWRSTRMERRRR